MDQGETREFTSSTHVQLAWHGSGACPSLTPLHFSAHFLSLYSSLRCCRLRPRRQSGRDRASPHCRSTLQLLAALSARVMEVPRLARSTGFPSTESGLEGTPAFCTRAPPHGAPSLRHTGRETRPRDAAAPHTSPPRLTCVHRRRAARCRKRRWGSCRPSSPMASRVGVERNKRKPILPGIFI